MPIHTARLTRTHSATGPEGASARLLEALWLRWGQEPRSSTRPSAWSSVRPVLRPWPRQASRAGASGFLASQAPSSTRPSRQARGSGTGASWRQEEALTTEGRGSQAKALARGWPEQERKGSRGAGVGVLPQHATTWRRGHQGRERRRGAGSSGVTARGLGGA